MGRQWTEIETFRTPAQHRRKIQGLGNNPQPIVKRVKPPKSKKKRARLDKAGNGTSSLSARMQALGYRLYVDYLASPHWLDVRQRWKAANLFLVCVDCHKRIHQLERRGMLLDEATRKVAGH